MMINTPVIAWARRLLVGVLAVAALTACSDDTPAPQVSVAPAESTTAAPTGPAPTGGQPSTAPSGSTTRDNVGLLTTAGRTAVAKSSGSTLTSIDLESTEQGGSIWEVTLVTRTGDEQDVELTADGKKVTRGPVANPRSASQRQTNLALVKAADLTYAEAAGKLPSTVKGGKITQLELRTEGGRVVWEANASDLQGVRHDIQLDAGSGKVLLDQS